MYGPNNEERPKGKEEEETIENGQLRSIIRRRSNIKNFFSSYTDQYLDKSYESKE